MIGKTNALAGGSSEPVVFVANDGSKYRLLVNGTVDTNNKVTPSKYSARQSKGLGGKAGYLTNDNGVIFAFADEGSSMVAEGWTIRESSNTYESYKLTAISSIKLNSYYNGKYSPGTYTCMVVGDTSYLCLISPVEIKFTVPSSGTNISVDLTYNLDELLQNIIITASSASSYMSGETFIGTAGGGYLTMLLSTVKKIA